MKGYSLKDLHHACQVQADMQGEIMCVSVLKTAEAGNYWSYILRPGMGFNLPPTERLISVACPQEGLP